MPTNSNDVINSTTLSEQILGLNGADQFHWSPGGHDTFIGGDLGEAYDTNVYFDKTGGDRLYLDGNRGAFIRFENTEDGLVTSGSSSLKFSGIERIHLTAGNDTLRAGSATLHNAHGDTPQHGLTIYAGAGNDDITATIYNDYIDGGDGNDVIRGGGGEDHIQSSRGNDVINGGNGTDNIRWGLGDNVAPGNDTIYGGTSNDGEDLINIWAVSPNGSGARVEFTGAEKGRAYTDMGGVQNTLLFFDFEQGWTHQGRDTVTGANAVIGADRVGIKFNTRDGDDILIGSAGNDTLEGGEGRDTITGGRGNDLISCTDDGYRPAEAPADAYVDTIVLRAGFGHDTIAAFGDNDILDAGGMSYSAVENSRGTLVTYSSGDSVLLLNVFDFI